MTERKSKNAVAIGELTDKQLTLLVKKLNEDSVIKHTKVSVVATLVYLKYKKVCK